MAFSLKGACPPQRPPAQCQNYLKATGKKLGMVINFGDEKVKIRRVANGFKSIISRDENLRRSMV